MATTKYVDLAQVGDGAGTEGDPYQRSQMITEMEAGTINDDWTYKLKGTGTESHGNDNIEVRGDGSTRQITLESWLDTPAKLKVNITSDGSAVDVFTFTNGAVLVNFKRLVVEANITGSNPSNIIFLAQTSGLQTAASFENSVLVLNGSVSPTSIVRFISGSFQNGASWAVKGSTFRNSLPVSTQPYAIYWSVSSGTATAELNSCYFDGALKYLVNGIKGYSTLNITIKYNAIYNNASFIDEQLGDANFTVSDNIDNSGSATLFPNLPNGIAMTIPDDIAPDGTALVDAGDSALGLSVDLLNDSRGTPPEIGPLEEQTTPTCWKYTARYKNSSKLFVANGPGDFPKHLKVPGNVDRSTGRMIDEGKLIDPSQYDVD